MVNATILVASAVLLLALTLPLIRLAEVTSFITLAVFALVNVSLFAHGRSGEHPRLVRWRWLGIVGAVVCLGVIGFQISSGIAGGH
jgi:amino acid transporter